LGSVGSSFNAPQEATAAASQTEDALRKEIRRLEDTVRDLSAASDRSEARFKRAEERANGVEERSERSSESLRTALEQVRSELRSNVSEAQKKQHDNGSAIQMLQMDQAQNSQVMTRIQEDIRKESTVRLALEDTARSSAETAERALRASEQAQKANMSFEDSIKERLETLEMKMDKSQMQSLKKLSVPDRIMYFQQAHRQGGVGVLKDEAPRQESNETRGPGTSTFPFGKQPLFRTTQPSEQ